MNEGSGTIEQGKKMTFSVDNIVASIEASLYYRFNNKPRRFDKSRY